MSLLEEFYERLPYHLGERGPLESRDIGEFSGLAERCDDRRCEARRIRWGETYVWERNAPEFLEVRGHDGPTCSRVFEHLDGACGVEVCVGITGIQTEIRCREVVGCLFVGDPSRCHERQTKLLAARNDWAEEIASSNNKEYDVRHLPGRERQGFNEKEIRAASQADEAHHPLALESEFCSGAIALTEGDPAHAHAVWNIDGLFSERLQSVDEDVGRAQHQVTVRDVRHLDVGVRDEIQTVEDPDDGQIEWRQANGFVTEAVNEDIDAQVANELSGVETEKLFVGPESSGVVLPKATQHMVTHHIRNAWSAVNCYAPLSEGGPPER